MMNVADFDIYYHFAKIWGVRWWGGGVVGGDGKLSSLDVLGGVERLLQGLRN